MKGSVDNMMVYVLEYRLLVQEARSYSNNRYGFYRYKSANREWLLCLVALPICLLLQSPLAVGCIREVT